MRIINKQSIFILVGGVLLLLINSGCKKNNSDAIPGCLIDEIIYFGGGRLTCDGSKVDEYLFQGQNVYLFDTRHCGTDQASLVLNSSCVGIGYIGGIIGADSINGASFSKEATLLRTIWTK